MTQIRIYDLSETHLYLVNNKMFARNIYWQMKENCNNLEFLPIFIRFQIFFFNFENPSLRKSHNHPEQFVATALKSVKNY